MLNLPEIKTLQMRCVTEEPSQFSQRIQFQTERLYAQTINQFVSKHKRISSFNGKSSDISYLLDSLREKEIFLTESNFETGNLSTPITPMTAEVFQFDKIKEILQNGQNPFLIKKKGTKSIDINQILQLPKKLNNQDLGPPTGRKDVEIVHEWMEKMLNKYVNTKSQREKRFQSLQSILHLAFNEIVRQVKVQCTQRGVILEQILQSYFEMFRQVESFYQKKLINLQEDMQDIKNQQQSFSVKEFNSKDQIIKKQLSEVQQLKEQIKQTLIIVDQLKSDNQTLEKKNQILDKRINELSKICEYLIKQNKQFIAFKNHSINENQQTNQEEITLDNLLKDAFMIGNDSYLDIKEEQIQISEIQKFNNVEVQTEETNKQSEKIKLFMIGSLKEAVKQMQTRLQRQKSIVEDTNNYKQIQEKKSPLLRQKTDLKSKFQSKMKFDKFTQTVELIRPKKKTTIIKQKNQDMTPQNNQPQIVETQGDSSSFEEENENKYQIEEVTSPPKMQGDFSAITIMQIQKELMSIEVLTKKQLQKIQKFNKETERQKRLKQQGVEVEEFDLSIEDFQNSLFAELKNKFNDLQKVIKTQRGKNYDDPESSEDEEKFSELYSVQVTMALDSLRKVIKKVAIHNDLQKIQEDQDFRVQGNQMRSLLDQICTFKERNPNIVQMGEMSTQTDLS